MAVPGTESSLGAPAARPWFRRLWYAALIALAVAPPIGAVGYMLYSGLLARETHRLVVPYDVYWDAAQFQLAYERFENHVLLYRNGIDEDANAVRASSEKPRSTRRSFTKRTRLRFEFESWAPLFSRCCLLFSPWNSRACAGTRRQWTSTTRRGRR